ncbi:hypothetical protein BC936DRAFT_147860 [Jimgerdemannia flammicorona]|uniref:MPN domain-containing protein n=1 Tax=Jimgerdemannia flammicorona TaxID=994334 RepID=A0A433D4A0_9FUNG|nr:hypothetical protein BC936DRAFT_147860 [Jimgerdemannia flammicorona]
MMSASEFLAKRSHTAPYGGTPSRRSERLTFRTDWCLACAEGLLVQDQTLWRERKEKATGDDAVRRLTLNVTQTQGNNDDVIMGQALDGYVYTVSGNSSSRPSILLHVHPMPATTAVPAGTTVVVHPLVLLSAVDHYNRAARNTRKRVVGVLLGQVKGKSVNVANSFAGEDLS